MRYCHNILSWRVGDHSCVPELGGGTGHAPGFPCAGRTCGKTKSEASAQPPQFSGTWGGTCLSSPVPSSQNLYIGISFTLLVQSAVCRTLAAEPEWVKSSGLEENLCCTCSGILHVPATLSVLLAGQLKLQPSRPGYGSFSRFLPLSLF